MPEGNRRTPVDISLIYHDYSENNVDGFHIYNVYLKGSNYLELPLDANVRLPSEKSYPYKEMMKTLEREPKNFFLQNSGISVISSKVQFNQSKKIISLRFPPDTGIVNGGHTQLAILETKKKRDIQEVRIKLEILEHDFKQQELAVIAASKNTASNVKPYSTAEKKGYFVAIKKCMIDHFEKHIIWYENREVPSGNGLSAIDLVAILNLFNVRKYQSQFNNSPTEQPNKSATSKNRVFEDWENEQSSYFHTYPLVNDIINLYEHIQTTFHKQIPKGFTTPGVVKNVKDQNKKTIFTGGVPEFELPKQFLLPILASMRANVKYDETNQKVGWYEKPEEAFDKSKAILIHDLLKTYKSTYHNEINRASKDSNLWRILYANVDTKIDKTKEWKLYDVPK